ncbi:hypothetical protein [Bogoriella caseilytica]|uniref:Uncharacterized protein n=1 Tax=Bogoriella caseilytica TaxID=56055 RepID=A0A3N2BC31_9MICO|nr:hypothetical protein [Bogoriella caseilytica]ROR72752.1 hypothetical protein EDD31_1111 [Bogoriella caseilytica]
MSPRAKELRHGSREGLLLRLAIVLSAAAVVALAAVTAEASPFDMWVVIVPMLLGIAAALAPQGVAPLALLVYLVMLWVLVSDDVASGWTLAVAAAVLIIHTAAALVAAVPVAAGWPAGIWRRYLVRVVAVFGAVTVVWVAVRLAAGATLPGGTVALVLAVLLAAAAVLVHDRWLRRSAAR